MIVGVCAVAAMMVAAGLFAREIDRRAVLSAPQATPWLMDRNGVFLAQISRASDNDRTGDGYWPLQNVPDRIARATLALEDRRFFDHAGVDAKAIARAAWQHLRGKRHRSGGSTIAMQVARMQQPASRTLLNKALEAGIALLLTQRYGREAVLAHYLRIVPYGNASHGTAHAARFYFDKPVDDLSWAEIALVAAVPQSPTRMNLFRPAGMRDAMRRGHRILDELAQRRVMKPEELRLAHNQLNAMQTRSAPRRTDALHMVLHYRGMIADNRLSFNPYDPRIRATIDLALQDKAAWLARRHVNAWRGDGAEQAAVMVVSRTSGEVLAQVGSVDYRGTKAGAYDFTRVQRSPGSTLKPFIYALALERGLLKPTDVLADLPDGAAGIGNADGQFLGPLLPRQALANSRNVPATNLVRSIGLDPVFSFLRSVGIHDMEGQADSFGLSMAIGSLPTRLDRLMRAYGALANDGQFNELVWAQGQKPRVSTRVMSADTARLITSFLADPQARLPSFPRYGPTEYPFPVALKTGTSQGFRDAWMIGWSDKVIVGVWIGRGDAGTMNGLTGGRTAARLAHAIIAHVQGTRAGDIAEARFPSPEGREPVEVCRVNGLASNGACGETLVEWLTPQEMREAQVATSESLRIDAASRVWAREEGIAPVPVVQRGDLGSDAPMRLMVTMPEHRTHIWRNPDQPESLNRLALKANVEPRVEQIVWYVDGEPFAITDPDRPVYWTMRPGVHRFQIRMPLRQESSRIVQVTIE